MRYRGAKVERPKAGGEQSAHFARDGKRGCSQKRKRIYVRPGWTNDNYWTGELNDPNNAYNVNVGNGNNGNDNVDNPNNRVVCGR